MAANRFFIEQSVYEEFTRKFVAEVKALSLGRGLGDPDIGPLMNENAVLKQEAHVADALAKGASLLCGGKRDPLGPLFYQPTVLGGVPADALINREETFGPVVGVMPVRSDEEAIKLMNDSPYGLSASIWTQNAEAAESIGNELEAGTVFMNRCDYLDPALAWTGVKHTGRGITLSKFGYSNLTRVKSFHFREEL